MNNEPIRILIVDDQELILRGTEMVLGQEPDIDVVGSASSGEQAIEMVTELVPDVVLMDVRMPGMDGIEATRRIARHVPHSRVLILTTFDLDEYAFSGLRAGAAGFLLKDAPTRELTAAIRAIAGGDALVSPRITRTLLDLYATQLPRDAPTRSTRLNELTERELDVFTAIAHGLTNTEIAAQHFVTESTVKTQVGRILFKLDLRDRVQAVILAYELGLA